MHLLGADDRDRHDRRAGRDRDACERAPAEPPEAIAVAEGLRVIALRAGDHRRAASEEPPHGRGRRPHCARARERRSEEGQLGHPFVEQRARAPHRLPDHERLVGHEGAAPVGDQDDAPARGHALESDRLDPPPVAVERLEDHLGRVRAEHVRQRREVARRRAPQARGGRERLVEGGAEPIARGELAAARERLLDPPLEGGEPPRHLPR